MKTLKRLLVIASISIFISGLYAQDKQQLILNFTSTDWNLVKNAKAELENLQGASIPELVNLLDSQKKVKLQNTGSLIYPGAEKFFGHGQILDYDIDYIAIRSGWLIEDISFNNFGFSGIHLQSDMIVNYIKITFPEYYNNSNNRKKIESASEDLLREIIQNLSVKAVKDWWKVEENNFNRLNALVDALKSFDEKRQVKALFYLRNGTSKCDGLTRDYYYEEISKEIVRLSGSDVQRIAEHAKLILLDSKLDWLEMKK